MSNDPSNLVSIKVLHDFADRIERLGIDYMVTGSMALAAYAIYRYTADVDVVMELKEGQIRALVSVLEPDYYVSESSARRAVSSERMFNVIDVDTAFKVDLYNTEVIRLSANRI